MKKLLSITVASLAFAAIADTTYTPITVGVDTFVPTTRNVVIPVPFSTIGSSADVSVHDLVKAANLPNGTMLYYFNGESTNYLAWIKQESAWTSTGISSTTIDSVSVSPASDTINVSVGSALWLVFPSETTLSEQEVVFYGSPVATTNSTIQCGKVNLLSNPTKATVSGTTLEAKLAEVAEIKDTIRLIGGDFNGEYVKATTGWKRNTGTGYEDATLPDIASYQGFWYISKSGSGTKTISW